MKVFISILGVLILALSPGVRHAEAAESSVAVMLHVCPESIQSVEDFDDLGGFLQILVLVVALVRSASARTLTGATLAAIFALVLVARPTLPLIEYGHSSIFYGAALAFAAALHTRARAPAPP